MPDYVNYQGCVSICGDHFRYADLSVQVPAGERIGDLPLIAEVVASQLAKIIENRFHRQSASPGP